MEKKTSRAKSKKTQAQKTEWFLIVDQMDCRAVLVSAFGPDDAKIRYLEANNAIPDDLDPDNEDFEMGFSVEPLKGSSTRRARITR